MHSLEYYAAIKRKEIPTQWMNLENITLSEINQTHTQSCMILLNMRNLEEANSYKQKVD